MSIRVDHIAELIPNENATKLPVNYGFAKINFMPERPSEQEPTIGEKTEISPKIDADYMKAVESGDVEAQQKLVDEAAKAAGYETKPLWHRTWSKFTEFALGGKNPETTTWRSNEGTKRTKVGESGRAIFLSYDQQKTPAFHQSKKEGERFIKGYANMNDPLIVDDDTRDFAIDVFAEGFKDFPLIVTEEARNSLIDAGHDSVHLYYKGRTTQDGNPDEVILLNPNQIKSADPVTYDDAGNVIPLSQRFNPKTSDIRFMPQRQQDENIKPVDLETSAKPESDAVIKPFSNALVSSVGIINFLPAYHGTPFEVDKFKLANIGTGEGAQAYGWGLYFAQARKVAEEYARVLANRDLTGYKNAQLNAKDIVSRLGGNAEYASEILRDQLQSIPENSLNFTRISDTLKMIETGEYAKDLEAQGNLYKVDIDVKDEDLLDWDKPLSEQSEKVQKALAEMNADYRSDSDEYDSNEQGQITYSRLGNPQEASKALLTAGIPGIRYLDGTSRKQGEGTYNYVVFDENLIKILDKNDKPVAGELPTKQPLGGIQFMPQRPVGKTQVGYDDTYLKSALASGTNGKVNLTRPIKPNEALPLLSQRVPITNEVDRDSFDYNSHGAVILYYHNGRPVTFKYDPQLIRRPQFKDISVEHAGKVVQLAMADRHTASGGDMGGPIHPWLKSLEEVEIYDPVTGQYLIGKWANNEWKPAKSMKDKSRAGATDLLVYTMDKESHGSNLRSIRIISNEIDNANLTQSEKDAFLVIANKAVKTYRLSEQKGTINDANKSIEEIKTKLKEETDKSKISKLNDELNSELKRISNAEQKIENYTISQDENDFSAIVRNYKTAMTRYQNGTGSEKAYKVREEELKNYMKTPAFKKLQKEVAGLKMINLDNTFDGRKAAEESLKGLTINKFNVDHILQEISDFENGGLHHFVASVELSKNPNLMAVYLGDDPKQAKFMTPEEAAAAKKIKANPNFVIHEAYSWLMLGPKNGNDFLNTNPKTHLDYFPWFKQQWADLKTDPAARERILKLGNDNLMNTMRDQKSIPLVMPKK
jgi:hypothetical protein